VTVPDAVVPHREDGRATVPDRPRKLFAVEALLAFAAALVTLRLAGDLVARWRARRNPALGMWAGALLAYALASGALAWGAAAGWDGRAFRAYYLFGGLLTAPLLGCGSLLLAGRRAALPVALVYAGLAAGIALAVPLASPVSGSSIPAAQDHLDFVPARLVAVLGNTLGTIAIVAVAAASLRRRPLGNALVLAGVAVAAGGTAVAGLGEAETSVFVAVAAALLYAGVVLASGERAVSLRALTSRRPAPRDLPPDGRATAPPASSGRA
jgi:hypothetical protein